MQIKAPDADDPGVISSQMHIKAPEPIMDLSHFMVEPAHQDWVEQSNTVRIFNNFAMLQHLSDTVER